MALEAYTFSEEFSHNIDWSRIQVIIIDSTEKLAAVEQVFHQMNVLFIDMEGDWFGNSMAKIGLIQVGLVNNWIFLFDTVKCRENLRFVRDLIESKGKLKVFHDCSGDISALDVETGGNIDPQNIFDVQLAQQFIELPPSKRSYNQEGYSLGDVYRKNTGETFPNIKVEPYFLGNKWLDKRPLTERMVKYAAADVMFLLVISFKQKIQISERWDLPAFRSALQKKIRCKICPPSSHNIKQLESLSPHGELHYLYGECATGTRMHNTSDSAHSTSRISERSRQEDMGCFKCIEVLIFLAVCGWLAIFLLNKMESKKQ